MAGKIIPGTNIEYGNSKDAFSVLRPMIEITGGLSLSQICRITNLQTSTIQNWVKRGFVQRPDHKKYYERHLSRILLIAVLRLINGDTDDESDDIVSEAVLYDRFCEAVRNIDDNSLNFADIEQSIEKMSFNEEETIKEKLIMALKVMVYAYLSGKCMKQIEKNLSGLRGK